MSLLSSSYSFMLFNKRALLRFFSLSLSYFFSFLPASCVPLLSCFLSFNRTLGPLFTCCFSLYPINHFNQLQEKWEKMNERERERERERVQRWNERQAIHKESRTVTLISRQRRRCQQVTCSRIVAQQQRKRKHERVICRRLRSILFDQFVCLCVCLHLIQAKQNSTQQKHMIVFFLSRSLFTDHAIASLPDVQLCCSSALLLFQSPPTFVTVLSFLLFPLVYPVSWEIAGRKEIRKLSLFPAQNMSCVLVVASLFVSVTSINKIRKCVLCACVFAGVIPDRSIEERTNDSFILHDSDNHSRLWCWILDAYESRDENSESVLAVSCCSRECLCFVFL